VISLAAALLFACVEIDADTAWCRQQGSELVERVRIPNADAPELFSPQCDAERALAERATAFTRAWLAKGPVELVACDKRDEDYFRRKLRCVRRGAEDLGEALVRAGLARPWEGRRRSWCP